MQSEERLWNTAECKAELANCTVTGGVELAPGLRSPCRRLRALIIVELNGYSAD
jgi:hypothetical protein